MQPALNSSHGVVLTIGINVLNDRAAVVLPIATDTSVVGPTVLAQYACDAAKFLLLPLFQAVMSTSANISYVQAAPMDRGIAIPYRYDFALADFPGEEITDPLPASLGGLITFYEEPADIIPPKKMSHSKMIIPGISEGMVTMGRLTAGALADLLTLGSAMCEGFADDGSSIAWYRVLSAPKKDDGNGVVLKRLIETPVVRSYVGSQRRRLLPRT